MFRKLMVLLLLVSLFLYNSCLKEDSFKPIPTSPTSDLTKGDCISCHTNANALLATLGPSQGTQPHSVSSGPLRKYSNQIQGDG
ncbi:MAG: hypothetical protein N2450_02800 [bacterium]|nr:hypothetical protein [bacterium]